MERLSQKTVSDMAAPYWLCRLHGIRVPPPKAAFTALHSDYFMCTAKLHISHFIDTIAFAKPQVNECLCNAFSTCTFFTKSFRSKTRYLNIRSSSFCSTTFLYALQEKIQKGSRRPQISSQIELRKYLQFLEKLSKLSKLKNKTESKKGITHEEKSTFPSHLKC